MRKFTLLVIFFVISLLITACSTESYQPVEITENVDTCYTCHMGIEDLQHAAQTLLEDGTPRVFDDIGCMLTYLLETNEEVAVSFVKDYQSENWLNIEQAFFVQDKVIQTPMSYGFIAFETNEVAKQFIDENGGTLFTGEQLLNYDLQKLKDWNETHTNSMHSDNQQETNKMH